VDVDFKIPGRIRARIALPIARQRIGILGLQEDAMLFFAFLFLITLTLVVITVQPLLLFLN
jgi:hypothetical protein